MTIYEIKARVTNAPHFFDRKTLKFFGQTLKSFSVHKMEDGRFHVSAGIWDRDGRYMGTTERYFNPNTNELERVQR